ncbi:MAG: glycosyltransferase [Nitrososphaerota archaeon]|nr:glycosyltransferase [Nitrososphaerota archaeon]
MQRTELAYTQARPRGQAGALAEAAQPLVSIIIPSRNGPSAATRASIGAQAYPNIEVIVVADGRERSAQINDGARAAMGEYLYRVDDDLVLEPGVVSEAVEACLGGCDAVVIHIESETSGRWARVRHLQRECYKDDFGSEFARFVSRTAFFSVGGFDEGLFAEEDRDFHDRLVGSGFRVGTVKAKETHIGEPRSLSDVVRRNAYYGPSFVAYYRKSGLRALLRLGPIRRSYIRHWREIAADPKMLCGFVVFEWVRYVSACAGALARERGNPSAGSRP